MVLSLVCFVTTHYNNGINLMDVHLRGDKAMNEFGNRLRELRVERKWSLRHLADKSKLSYSFIGSLEKGRFHPSRESISALAQALDADTNELLMLAGFLPDQPPSVSKEPDSDFTPKEKAFLKNLQELSLEELMDTPLTFRGKELKAEDKASMISFLQTLLDLREGK
jgi:transcriptional regulator with XRE-family HTH domain